MIQLGDLPTSAIEPELLIGNVNRLKNEVERHRDGLENARSNPAEVRDNLLGGIRQYRDQASKLVSSGREEFLSRLEDLRSDLDRLKD